MGCELLLNLKSRTGYLVPVSSNSSKELVYVMFKVKHWTNWVTN